MLSWIALFAACGSLRLAEAFPVSQALPGCPFYNLPTAVQPATLTSTAIGTKGAINPNFYTTAQRSCILKYVKDNIAKMAGIGDFPGLIRLAFHDALAGGANGSLMKQVSEQTTQPTLSGFEIVAQMRNQTEATCRLPLSYADAIVLCSAASVIATGGLDFMDALELGRADVAFSDSPALVPIADWTALPMAERWRQVNMTIKDTVAISGAHTVGQVHCTTLYDRFVYLEDEWMDEEFRGYVQGICESIFNSSIPDPVGGGGANVGPQLNLDQYTPDVFDNGYFISLKQRKGLLLSDQALFSDDVIPQMKQWVDLFAADNEAFLEAYKEAFLKMTLVGLQLQKLAVGQSASVPKDDACFSNCCPDSVSIVQSLLSAT